MSGLLVVRRQVSNCSVEGELTIPSGGELAIPSGGDIAIPSGGELTRRINNYFRRQELLEYIDVHDNDASESSQPSWGKMCISGTLLTLMLPGQLPGGVRMVSDTKETIRFKLDTQEITYTVDMFRDTLKLPVETFDNLFITPRMRIPDAFFTDEIHATDDYKETTPRAYMTPTLTAASPYGKKRKQGAGETSLPRKSLKVTIRRKKQSTPSIPPPSDDRERDKIDKATILSLTLHKAALAAEAQESNAKVQKSVEEGD
ncbi:hypothetical protein Tco_0098732 [Tanacetum coccineum]